MKEKLKKLLGDHTPSTVFTVINFVFCVVWIITYIGCTIMRASVFDSALERMANASQNFTVTVTSPAFSILRVALYVFPVLSIAWGICVYKGDKKAKIPDKKVLLIVLGLMLVTCFTALLDLARLGVFSYL